METGRKVQFKNRLQEACIDTQNLERENTTESQNLLLLREHIHRECQLLHTKLEHG